MAVHAGLIAVDGEPRRHRVERLAQLRVGGGELAPRHVADQRPRDVARLEVDERDRLGQPLDHREPARVVEEQRVARPEPHLEQLSGALGRRQRAVVGDVERLHLGRSAEHDRHGGRPVDPRERHDPLRHRARHDPGRPRREEAHPLRGPRVDRPQLQPGLGPVGVDVAVVAAADRVRRVAVPQRQVLEGEHVDRVLHVLEGHVGRAVPRGAVEVAVEAVVGRVTRALPRVEREDEVADDGHIRDRPVRDVTRQDPPGLDVEQGQRQRRLGGDERAPRVDEAHTQRIRIDGDPDRRRRAPQRVDRLHAQPVPLAREPPAQDRVLPAVGDQRARPVLGDRDPLAIERDVDLLDHAERARVDDRRVAREAVEHDQVAPVRVSGERGRREADLDAADALEAPRVEHRELAAGIVLGAPQGHEQAAARLRDGVRPVAVRLRCPRGVVGTERVGHRRELPRQRRRRRGRRAPEDGQRDGERQSHATPPSGASGRVAASSTMP